MFAGLQDRRDELVRVEIDLDPLIALLGRGALAHEFDPTGRTARTGWAEPLFGNEQTKSTGARLESTAMNANPAIEQLLGLADQYDEAAKNLRSAAKLLKALPPLPTETTEPAVSTAIARPIPETEYLAVYEASPYDTFAAQDVYDRMVQQGVMPASVDAVRAAVYRLTKSGKLVKVGHGKTQLAHQND